MSQLMKSRCNMKSNYFREQHRYSFNDIQSKLGIEDSNLCIEIIDRLKSCNILKVIKNTITESTLYDTDEEYDDVLVEYVNSNDTKYVFKFVGIISIKNNVIICYPKYIRDNINPIKEMKQVLKVIEKYNSKEQIIDLSNGEEEEKTFNLLASMLYLISDYNDNGLYCNHQDVIEMNGEGEIIWDKTINETFAFLRDNRPFYLDLYTNGVIEDEMDFFRRLHQIILTECSTKLENLNISILFDIESIYLSDISLEEFADKEYILYRLEQELKSQFITQKQGILKTLYTYIANRKSNEIGIGISFYGTNSFNLVWESVCGNILDNKLRTRISQLPIGLVSKFESKKENTLIELIEKPIWIKYNENSLNGKYDAKKTLTPDLINISKLESGQGYGFWILDAKYYNINFDEKSVYNSPGVEDVTKEYLYQLAYKEFIDLHRYKFKENIFLFPSDKDEIENIGQAKMSMFLSLAIDLKDIELVKLPAVKAYNMYLNDELMAISNIEKVIKNNKFGNKDYNIKDIVSETCVLRN